MKIWFDLSNSPHINMFYEMICELEKNGHEIIITCRPLANTIDLLDQKGLRYTVVGEHYGKNFYKKVLGFPVRVFQLRKFLSPLKPDIAVSQSSFHSPLVAKLLGIPSIYTNDNEHALGNLVAFYFATKIFIPENLPIENIAKKGISRKKIFHYPGVKEGIYLWRKGETLNQKRLIQGNSSVKIFIRPEPLTAQYYKGGLNFLDDLLMKIQDQYSITVLPRDKTQLQHYKRPGMEQLIVPEKPLQFDEIAGDCTIFIGAGGSMTRELAILGVPTISVYQDELLAVDKYLIEKGVLVHKPNLKEEDISVLVACLQNKQLDFELMQKGKTAYYFFINEILKFQKND
jgi:predicted glycosyltransferase